MWHIWDVLRIQYKKTHPKEDLTSPKVVDEELDQNRAESIRAQKKARERIQKQQGTNLE